MQEEVFLDGCAVFLPASELAPLDHPATAPLYLLLQLSEERARWATTKRSPDFALSQEQRSLRIGRLCLPVVSKLDALTREEQRFAITRPTKLLIESLATSVLLNQPVLLVGETGTGKTATISFLASSLGHRLVSLNLSTQSEASDLLGGYKPIDKTTQIQRKEAESCAYA